MKILKCHYDLLLAHIGLYKLNYVIWIANKHVEVKYLGKYHDKKEFFLRVSIVVKKSWNWKQIYNDDCNSHHYKSVPNSRFFLFHSLNI